MQELVEFFVSIGKQVKLLTVLPEYLNIGLVSHMSLFLQDLIRGLLLLLHHRIVALLNKFFEARYLEYVLRVGLVLLIRVGGDPQQVSLQGSDSGRILVIRLLPHLVLSHLRVLLRLFNVM